MIDTIKALLSDAFDGGEFDFAALVNAITAIVEKIFAYIGAEI